MLVDEVALTRPLAASVLADYPELGRISLCWSKLCRSQHCRENIGFQFDLLECLDGVWDKVQDGDGGELVQSFGNPEFNWRCGCVSMHTTHVLHT